MSNYDSWMIVVQLFPRTQSKVTAYLWLKESSSCVLLTFVRNTFTASTYCVFLSHPHRCFVCFHQLTVSGCFLNVFAWSPLNFFHPAFSCDEILNLGVFEAILMTAAKQKNIVTGIHFWKVYPIAGCNITSAWTVINFQSFFTLLLST